MFAHAKQIAVAGVIAAALLLGGCNSDEPVPPANRDTCKPEFIKTLKTDKARKALGTACATSGDYNLSKGKSW